MTEIPKNDAFEILMCNIEHNKIALNQPNVGLEGRKHASVNCLDHKDCFFILQKNIEHANQMSNKSGIESTKYIVG